MNVYALDCTDKKKTCFGLYLESVSLKCLSLHLKLLGQLLGHKYGRMQVTHNHS